MTSTDVLAHLVFLPVSRKKKKSCISLGSFLISLYSYFHIASPPPHTFLRTFTEMNGFLPPILSRDISISPVPFNPTHLSLPSFPTLILSFHCRVSSPGGESGAGLCHHDWMLRICQGFFSAAEPPEDACPSSNGWVNRSTLVL